VHVLSRDDELLVVLLKGSGLLLEGLHLLAVLAARLALIYTIITFLIFVILLISLWLSVGVADIPYTLYTTKPSFCLPTNLGLLEYYQDTSSATLSISVSFFVYMVSLMSAFGWILFFAFGGVGLVAFPIDFISAFKNRPKSITGAEFASEKINISKEAEKLIQVGKKLDEDTSKGKSSRKHRKKVQAFKQESAALEKYYEKLVISAQNMHGQLLKAIGCLILGVIGGILSICWLLHIILNNAAKVTPFLNNMFIAMDSAFALFGVLAYALFAFYLLWCVVKGCSKVGMNLVIFTVYPMELNNTLMNAFCFNTLLILICSVTVVQFCANSFSDYAANTAVNTLFTTYASRLKGIKYVLIYLQYPLLGVAALSLLWLLICPKRKVDPDSDDD
jgi:LMBR1 domain-containing protein 1